ncbi:MAG: hypothetical protein EPO01_16360, partial [Aquabacterium sp.]
MGAGKPAAGTAVHARTHAKPSRAAAQLPRPAARLDKAAARRSTAIHPTGNRQRLVSGAAVPRSAGPASPADKRASAEARLLEIYRLIGAARSREALDKAAALVADVPNFQLAQLTYADLLTARTSALPNFGAVPNPQQLQEMQSTRLTQLREEAAQRLHALRERPPAGAIPRQFIELPRSTQHAIAVDASRSRLYLFENQPDGPRLIADHYVSLGRLGVDKTIVGDQRTPLGVYFITNRLDGRQLADFYGTGALPLNYPNEYDRRLGKTGSGIWLHGVPTESYARSPRSTDGCVVLSNEDLNAVIGLVKPRTTPVLIAQKIDWVQQRDIASQRTSLRNVIEGWRSARIVGDVQRTLSFYASLNPANPQDLSERKQQVERDIGSLRGRRTNIKDLSILTWNDKTPLMVVTFGEVIEGERTGPVKRQYWSQESGMWKIFYEGVI